MNGIEVAAVAILLQYQMVLLWFARLSHDFAYPWCVYFRFILGPFEVFSPTPNEVRCGGHCTYQSLDAVAWLLELRPLRVYAFIIHSFQLYTAKY